MKISLLAGVAVAAMVLAAPQASAGGYKPYVSVFGGASVLTQNPNLIYNSGGNSGTTNLLMNNPGYIIGGAVGVDWGNQLRTELELSHARWSSDKFHYRNSSIDGASGTINATSDMSATYLLGNAWFDLSQGSKLTPYIGGGLGIGWANINAFTSPSFIPVHFNASGLAFQVGAGVRFDVSDNVTIDAGYRFKDIVGLSYSSDDPGYTVSNTSLASHNFQVGLTLKF